MQLTVQMMHDYAARGDLTRGSRQLVELAHEIGAKVTYHEPTFPQGFFVE